MDDFLAWEVEQSDGESEGKEVKSEPAFIEMMEGENQLWEAEPFRKKSITGVLIGRSPLKTWLGTE